MPRVLLSRHAILRSLSDFPDLLQLDMTCRAGSCFAGFVGQTSCPLPLWGISTRGQRTLPGELQANFR